MAKNPNELVAITLKREDWDSITRAIARDISTRPVLLSMLRPARRARQAVNDNLARIAIHIENNGGSIEY